MFNFIKYHWFGLILSLVFALFVLQFVIVVSSPHYDLQKRGFVVCDEEMSESLRECRKTLCVLKAVSKNSYCNFEVIGKGLSAFFKGEQKRPWDNYIFEPEYPQDEILDGQEEYYLSHPEMGAEMAKIKLLNQELEKEDNEE
ncbi:MAG: hypothetical protein IJ689_05095 [Alphaproteobacteria bacterium]|nr:hypothetical protein [Alphaproteobacteria bacterium]